MPTYSGTTVPSPFAESTASPNATVYVDSIKAPGSTTNVDLALTPKGTGALTAQVADGTTAGGNKRGANAVDWQTTRSAAAQVASGANAFIGGGQNNTASGLGGAVGGGTANSASSTYAVVAGGANNTATNSQATVGGGDYNVASGTYAVVAGGYHNTASSSKAMVGGGDYNVASGSLSFVGGGAGNYATGSWATVGGGNSNTASGSLSVAGGYRAYAELYGKFAHASGWFSGVGDAQFGLLLLRGITTSAATVLLTSDLWMSTPVASATNHTVIANNRVFGFRIDLIANSGAIGTSGTTYGLFGGQWTITGLARRATGVGTTAIIGTPYVTANADASLAAVTVAVTAETVTYGSIQVTVGGLAATNIHWVGQIQTTEVG